MKNKLDINSIGNGIVELSQAEKSAVNGGDKFLKDIGRFFGLLVNAFENQHLDSGSSTASMALH